MVKYLMLSIATFFIIGCVIKPTTQKEKSADVAQSKKTIKKKPLPEEFKEIKKLKPLEANVPKLCLEWSDGCNTCTRAENNQASCTVYTCENKAKFSCLKWQ